MDILNKPIKTFNFNNVVAFCKEGYIEGLQIDYKREIPAKGLSKHFAAFSNTRGGVIIIGVEENEKTGVPKNWSGIKNEGKLIDRIHQYATNVEPLPLYEIHTTDEKNGKVFLLIRIFEGDRTPYYVQNDANLWVRTGNISKPIDIASPDAAELLFGKKEKAISARENYIKRASDVYQAALSRAEKERLALIASGDPESELYKYTLGSNASLCTIVIQPFYPAKALKTPQELKASLRSITASSSYEAFPPSQMDPIPEGLLNFFWGQENGFIECSQIYSNGLIYNLSDVLRVDPKGKKTVYISQITSNLLIILKFAKNFYSLLGYQGGLIGCLLLENAEDVLLQRILPSGWNNFSKLKSSLLSTYTWDLELDTFLLNNDKECQDFYIKKIKEIYWGLGYEPAKEELYKAYLKEQGWT